MPSYELKHNMKVHHKTRRQSSLAVKGSTVSFHDIYYTVKVKGRKCTHTDKHILKGVSGVFKPGTMNAIMGATGSGKTSLLDILANRKDPRWLSGVINIDGQKQPANFKCMSGYVVQDDVVMGTLSVRENLMFSANLRLPGSVSVQDKKIRVQDTIDELGLDHVADSKIGNAFIRGVSGGERKRTNIGMELIISPSVIFLDEPTTGLDASTANAVMLLLHRLSRKGRTIIFSIHQPRYSIFKLFDRLVLLSRGHMVYQGPGEDALQYFESIGYECEAHNNPADFFLDVINGDSSAIKMQANLEKKEAETHAANGIYEDIELGQTSVNAIKPSPEGVSDDHLATELCQKFQASTWYQGLSEELKHEKGDSQTTDTKTTAAGVHYATSFFTQLRYVSKRAVINNIRNPQTSIMQVVIMIIFGLIVGLIYLNVTDEYREGVMNRTGAFFFIIMNQVFGNLSSVELFIHEREIFIHENSNGFYRVSAYFLSKVFCDIIPLRLVPITFFTIITYFMIGFRPGADHFFIYMLTLILTTLTAASLGFLFSALVRVFAVANLLIALCYVIMMVFGGYMVKLSSIASWLQWLKYISIFRYAMDALLINELKGLPLEQTIPLPNNTITLNVTGDWYLREQEIPYETAWDLWQNVVALFCMAVILMTLTYIILRRINKYK